MVVYQVLFSCLMENKDKIRQIKILESRYTLSKVANS